MRLCATRRRLRQRVLAAASSVDWLGLRLAGDGARTPYLCRACAPHPDAAHAIPRIASCAHCTARL
ncbi:hypothetical protein EON67_06695 [archaeon]|nr:MAG: hypothetical protein EON67_06695 [archaeon]